MGKPTQLDSVEPTEDLSFKSLTTTYQRESSINSCDYENELQSEDEVDEEIKPVPYKMQIVWRNVFSISLLHIVSCYIVYLIPSIHNGTLAYLWCLEVMTMVGVQSGAHRLWTHRSYKANTGVRILLSMLHVMALQNDLYEWCRDHRVHHKFSETDADPHNSKRGFFFAHMGWLMCRKHPEVIRKGATVDMSDLKSDLIVQFQRKFYIPLVVIFWALIPTYLPMYFWNESVVNAFMTCVIFRYVYTLHVTWSVNSWAHLVGNKPYNRHIGPVETSVRHMVAGEGFHNYHHTFPWDYSASELGANDVYNPATFTIDIFHYFGWAWDLKKAPRSLVDRKIQSTGDVHVRGKRGHGVYEWFGGTLVSMAPSILMFIAKYTYLYFN